MLKRETVGRRKARREGRREDAVRTAGKLLGVQMRRRAEEEERRRREERDRAVVAHVHEEIEEEIPEELVYVDELQMTARERVQNRAFRKTDAYHLPALDVGLAEMGAPNDPRVMSHEELEEYAKQFHTGEDVSVYDFSKIDFNGSFFLSLPASDRYNILNAARLRSRLRMGYSKEQLDTMFPDRMAFSRFQIERVTERNELTQRLMNINGMNGENAMFGVNDGGRVAGEKGKEYVLVKNDGVEGGWALGVVSNKGEGERNKPIDVDGFGKQNAMQEDEEDGWEDDGFEDVPIEGLNRLPKRVPATPALEHDGNEFDEVTKQRQALYEARQRTANGDYENLNAFADDTDSLFVPQEAENEDENMDGLFQDVLDPSADDDDELDRAIAMSLEQPKDSPPAEDSAGASTYQYLGPRIDQPLEFNQKNAKIGRDCAHSLNARANGAAPIALKSNSHDEDDANLRAALDESRRNMHKSQGNIQSFGRTSLERQANPAEKSPAHKSDEIASSPKQPSSRKPSRFDGPLPFESLNLGTSMLRKKKKAVEADAGGFEKEPSPKSAQPLPPWFSGDIHKPDTAQKTLEDIQYNGHDRSGRDRPMREPPLLQRQQTGEVIDIDTSDAEIKKFIDVESSADEAIDDLIMGDIRHINTETRMDDVANLIRAEPPVSDLPSNNDSKIKSSVGKSLRAPSSPQNQPDPEEPVEWEESDPEEDRLKKISMSAAFKLDGDNLQRQASKSTSPDFENVGISQASNQRQQSPSKSSHDEMPTPSLPREEPVEDQTLEALPADDDEDYYSDPEDGDLMRQLAIEAEEHARFASTLNANSQLQSADDYEKELRQLRNQQKKDRRDADEVSHIMITECQQLLKLFGLPYVTAPMEAEAQCAELVSLGLVDGIVTDDSDIFLFGGTRVYKNMFNQGKFVECYLSSDLEKEYSLDRQKLIRIAHLLGSDYTEGLPSVGPVTALEILSEFETLEAFSDWWSYVQIGQTPSAEDAGSAFRRKFRRNASKIFLPAVFPDKRVDHAYLHPEVDRDPSAFAWGVPDLDALRQFLMATIGWTQERTDEVLVPVIKDMNRRENEGTQANITQFFRGSVGVGGRQNVSGGSAFAPRRKAEAKSKRMENALGRLHQQAKNQTIGEDEEDGAVDGETHGTSGEATNDTLEQAEVSKAPQKRKSQKRVAPPSVSESASDLSGDDAYKAPKKPKTRGKANRRGRKMAKSS